MGIFLPYFYYVMFVYCFIIVVKCMFYRFLLERSGLFTIVTI